MLLIRCKFKCYSHHFIIYSDLKNVLNLLLLPILLDPRKHISADFNNAKDIFVTIQFVTID